MNNQRLLSDGCENYRFSMANLNVYCMIKSIISCLKSNRHTKWSDKNKIPFLYSLTNIIFELLQISNRINCLSRQNKHSYSLFRMIYLI